MTNTSSRSLFFKTLVSPMLTLACGAALLSPSYALQKADNDGTGPAQRSPLEKPASTPSASPSGTGNAAASNSSVLIPGKYLLKITANQHSLTQEVQLSRNTNQVILTTLAGEVLTGSIGANGQFTLNAASGNQRVILSATPQAKSASGTAQVKMGAQTKSGAFTLTEVQKPTAASGSTMTRKPIQQFVEPEDRKKAEEPSAAMRFWNSLTKWW